jgi:hypothetical protein
LTKVSLYGFVVLVLAAGCHRPLNVAACANHDGGWCGEGMRCELGSGWSRCVPAGGGEPSDAEVQATVDAAADQARPTPDTSTDVPMTDDSAVPADTVSPSPDLSPDGPSCPGACTPGAQRCGPSGGVQACSGAAGACPSWGSESACPAPTSCKQSGMMASCTCGSSGCVLNTQQCGPGGGVQTCVPSAGCTSWSGESPCQGPASCHQTGATATCCANTCTAGSSRCGPGGGVQTCVMGTACTSWGAEIACQAPKACQQTGPTASCISTLKTNGSTCGNGAECASGFCVDGVCCNRACSASCEACDIGGAVGTCSQVLSGQPHGTRAPCSGSGACAGACMQGSAQCTFSTGPCGPASCNGSTLTGGGTCSMGTCNPGGPQNCAPYACSASKGACLSPCATSADCDTNYFCSEGTCVSDVTAVATGYWHTCALRKDGKMFCWGDNSTGELGTSSGGNVLRPAEVPNMPSVKQLALGGGYTCAITPADKVMCWGDDQYGQLGDGVAGGNRSTPAFVKKADGNDLANVYDIAAGSCFTCALAADGVYCWGCNNASQLGRDSTSLTQSPSALLVPSSSGATLLAVGDEVAHFSDGGKVCGWGSNAGKAISGTADASFATPSCFSLSGILQTVLGRGWGCARLASGAVQCWGLQIGSSNIVAPPGMAQPGLLATKLGGGEAVACARLADGSEKCWGANNEGGLGDGTMQDETVATAVVDNQGIPLSSVLSDGQSKSGVALHSCAIQSDGALRCWGWNEKGQIGIGTSMTDVRTATLVRW